MAPSLPDAPHGLLACTKAPAVRRGLPRRCAVHHQLCAVTFTQSGNALDNRYLQQALVFVAFGIYFGWFWAKGQTLAMKTWHIRVVDRHGNAADAGARAVALPAELAVVSCHRWRWPGSSVCPGQQLSVLLVGWVCSGRCSRVSTPSASSCTTRWPARAWCTSSRWRPANPVAGGVLEAMSPTRPEPVNAQKLRTGPPACGMPSATRWAGLARRAGSETAFRQEALAAIVLVPLAFWLGRSWVETVLLAAP